MSHPESSRLVPASRPPVVPRVVPVPVPVRDGTTHGLGILESAAKSSPSWDDCWRHVPMPPGSLMAAERVAARLAAKAGRR